MLLATKITEVVLPNVYCICHSCKICSLKHEHNLESWKVKNYLKKELKPELNSSIFTIPGQS